jgi:serine/threonine protein kinase
MNTEILCFSAFFLGISIGLLNSTLPKASSLVKPKKKKKKKKTKKTEEQKEDNQETESNSLSPEIVKEDLEVLSDIYQDDIIIITKPTEKETKFKVFLYPNVRQIEINCSVYLYTVFPLKYPLVPPVFELLDPVGIPVAVLSNLKESLKSKVVDLISKKKQLVFEVCTWVKEELINMNPTPTPSPTATMDGQKREESSEDSQQIFDNRIEQEFFNRQQKNNQPVLLNSVNQIKNIEKDLIDSSYKIPCTMTKFDYRSYFEEIELLGKGGGGVVYKVTNKLDGCLYAMKIINMKGKKESYVNHIMKEVLVLSRLQHQNIVRYHNAWFEEGSDDEEKSIEEDSESEESSGDSSPSDDWDFAFQRSGEPLEPFMWEKEAKKVCKLYIQMEYCAGKSLQEVLNNGTPTTDESWKMLKEILHGLVYIHSRNTIHRDLKPSNIFLGGEGEVKLGDFGLAATNINREVQEYGVGTPLYWSPEQETGKYDQKSDIYSLGIIFYEMWRSFGSMMQKVNEIKCLRSSQTFPDDFIAPDEVKSIIIWLVKSNPEDRPTAEQVLRSRHLPHQMDNETYAEFLRVAMRPNTVENELLNEAIFNKDNLDHIEFTYNTTIGINNVPMINRRKVKIDSMLMTNVTMKLQEVFINAGAVEIPAPLLYPYYNCFTVFFQDRIGKFKPYLIEKAPGTPILLERSGILVQLPENSFIPWARKIAKKEYGGIIKRYGIQNIYKSAGTREHPEEYKQISFDICYQVSLYNPILKYSLQAELLAVTYNSIKQIFIEQEGLIEIKVNDSRIIDALMDYFEIKTSIRSKILNIFSNMFRLPSVALKKKLGLLGLNFSICEKLESYFKLQGKLSQIKDTIKKRPIFKDKILQQLLNEELALLEQSCEYYGLKNICFDFSVVQENLLCYSGFLCRIVYKDTGNKLKKNKSESCILAEGGCYDNLISHYTKPEKSKNKSIDIMSGIGITIYYDTIISLLLQSSNYSWLRGPSVFLTSNFDDHQHAEIDEILKKKIEMTVELWKNGISAIYNYNFIEKDEIYDMCRRYKIRFWVSLEPKLKKSEKTDKKDAEKKETEKKDLERKESDTTDSDYKISLRDNAQTLSHRTTEDLSRKDFIEIIKEKLKKGFLRLSFLTKMNQDLDE